MTKEEIQRRYYLKHRLKILEKSRLYRKNNPDKRRETQRKYRSGHIKETRRAGIKNAKVYNEIHPERVKKRKAEYYIKNSTELKKKNYILSIKQRKELMPGYINYTLKKQGFAKEAITPKLVELQKTILKIKRKHYAKIKKVNDAG